MRLHAWIDRPNLYVKIPATKPGLGAIEDCIAHGKSINVTLIFSLQRYREVVEAYLRGLERLVASGGDPAKVHSVASFFVSRVDTEADKRLEAIGERRARSARQARDREREARVRALSRGVRRPALGVPRRQGRDGRSAASGRRRRRRTPSTATSIYVEELIGPDTVNTMPAETIARLPGSRRGARRHRARRASTRRDKLLERAARRSASTTTTSTETLELEGVQKFADSFAELLDGVRAKRGELAAA